jgi:hypothetical protein
VLVSATRTNDAETDALQRHDAALAVTSTVTRPPPAPTFARDRSMSKRHGASRCVTISSTPFTRTAPERLDGSLFSSMVSVMDPSP